MGRELVQMIAELTGLPQHLVIPEIERLLIQSNKNLETMTLEDFREVLALYLQEVLLKAKGADI